MTDSRSGILNCLDKVAQKRIAVIGIGAMGGSVVSGLLGQCYDRTRLSLANPHREKMARFEEIGVSVTVDNIEAVRDAGLTVLAVEPWVVPDVVAEIKDHLDYDSQEVCVIAAGIGSEKLASMFEKDGRLPSLSIAIPNTGMTVCESMTFLVEVSGKAVMAKDIFDRLGMAMVINEEQLPGATALASCGMAYIMRYVRAACEGGVELGFRAGVAKEIVAQTIKGAAEILMQPGTHPESEIDKVTTAGGITIKGLNAMEKAGFTASVIEGLRVSAGAIRR